MIKAGLLGLGMIGKVHLSDGYEKLKDKISLEACFDISPDNFPASGNIRCYTDLDKFLKNEQGRLDYLDICLPTFLHKEVAIKAMEMGFNVLCEKPMALSFEDTKEMYEVSLKTGKKLMIAHVLRFMDDYEIIKQVIEDEALGKIRNVQFNDFRKGLPGGANGWFKNSSLSGGPLLDVHIHDTDILMWYFGKPEFLSAIAPKISEDGYFDSMTALAYYKDGLIVDINCDFSLTNIKHNRGRSLRLIFENGYILKNSDTFVMVDADGSETDLFSKRCEGFYDNLMYKKEIEYFADSIALDTPLSKCDPEESIYSTRFVFAECESAKACGAKIKL